ncbi:hypothetical protein A3844_19255 [Paenibacillus helianthi]|uniref:Uncharacterized protein n=1 Tax=Paenibacillus helianthi TaxID=1349432 RepID=A0ABX3ENN3_9BACL|nr:hypothetical protein [Paenibacillus helianthi]OKP84628.1 hypothetical protein A3844_19255 [Paenibacillus helianthi]
MENISTGLKWVIGIIVTILIIAAGVSIYLIINNYFIRAQEQTLAQTQMINQAEFNSYDNKDVSGQDVINAAMRYRGTPQFTIIIKTGVNKTGFYAENSYKTYYTLATEKKGETPAQPIDYSKKNDSTKAYSVSEMLDQSKKPSGSDPNVNVNTLSIFKSTVIRDNNGQVRIIVFNQNPKD